MVSQGPRTCHLSGGQTSTSSSTAASGHNRNIQTGGFRTRGILCLPSCELPGFTMVRLPRIRRCGEWVANMGRVDIYLWYVADFVVEV